MPMIRAREVLFAGLAVTSLVGCGSVGRFEAAPAKVVDLSGNWVIDRALSDDPKPIIAKLRPQPRKHGWDEPTPDETEDTEPQQDGSGRQTPGGGGQARRGGGQAPQIVYRNSNEAYLRSAVLKALSADLARAGYLTIQQGPELFSIDYGSEVRSFTPGAVSVVSAGWGVGDQSSGWKGNSFVIQVKPQQGVASVETYLLGKDGNHLVEELSLGGGDFPFVKLKRVYDRTEHPVQRAVPMTD